MIGLHYFQLFNLHFYSAHACTSMYCISEVQYTKNIRKNRQYAVYVQYSTCYVKIIYEM